MYFKIFSLFFILFLSSNHLLLGQEFHKIKIEKPGEITNQEEFKEQGIKRVLFANKVVLNMKKTDYEKDKIIFQINLAGGALTVPSGKEVMTHFAPTIINNGGLKNTTDKELKEAISGKSVSAHFSILENSFLIQSKTTPLDFELNLQLCRAKLIDSAFSEEAFVSVKQSIEKNYLTLSTDISEYFRNAVKRKITNNDNSLSLPGKGLLDSITLIDIKDWLTLELNNAPLEINVVGDIDEKKTIELVATYFGSLPVRKEIQSHEKNRNYLKGRFDAKEEFNNPLKTDFIFMMFQTVDFREVESIRVLNIVGKILKEKITKQMKAKIANTRSLYIEHYYNEDIKNLCYFRIAANSRSDNTEALINIIHSAIKELLEKGISEQELEEIRKPYLEQLTNFSKTNEYWLNNVLRNSTAEQKNLDAVLTFLKSYRGITIQQVNEFAKRYLDLGKKSTFVIYAKELKK